MNLEKLFSTLAGAVIHEETTAKDGSLALPSEMYTFIEAEDKGTQIGSVICRCKQGENLVKKELSALALIELAKQGTSVYNYEDMMLGMCRVLGGVAGWGENNTFTKKLTIV